MSWYSSSRKYISKTTELWFLEFPNGHTELTEFTRANESGIDIDNLGFTSEIVNGRLVLLDDPVQAWPLSACGEARWCYNSSHERDGLHQERPSSIVE